jgi:hypothetical protein
MLVSAVDLARANAILDIAALAVKTWSWRLVSFSASEATVPLRAHFVMDVTVRQAGVAINTCDAAIRRRSVRGLVDGSAGVIAGHAKT